MKNALLGLVISYNSGITHRWQSAVSFLFDYIGRAAQFLCPFLCPRYESLSPALVRIHEGDYTPFEKPWRTV
jgi:hypothetical protein